MLPSDDKWLAETNGSLLVEVKRLYFVEKVIPTSGYDYIECRFDNCAFESGVVNMRGCLFNSDKEV